jgi:hypothetical protein
MTMSLDAKDEDWFSIIIRNGRTAVLLSNPTYVSAATVFAQ